MQVQSVHTFGKKKLEMRTYLLLIILLITTTVNWSQGLKTQGKIIVNSNGEEVILRGLGPGGWLIMEGYMMQTSGIAGSQHEIKAKLIDLMGETNTETFFEKWRENHFTQRDVDSLAAWGFNSIRIPMHYNLFTLPIEDEPVSGENTWIETGFELIDNVLAWSAPHNMYVILDMHATPGGQGTGSDINDYDPTKPSLWESQENKDKLVALWTRIADRYKDNEWIGGYDLINETHWDLPGGTDLRQLHEDITEGIRSVDSNHILFIEGNWYANDFTGLTPAWDSNMVYSFHKYWNTNNKNDLDWILPLREQTNVPLWMGESGENSNTWFTDAVKLFENNGIGWAWWTMRKIGDIDSPYAVDINPGYQKIIDYWKGNGPRPTAQEAFDGMMQLAENLLVDNSKFRKDVPDALIRQVQTDETKPYNDTPAEIPGVVYMSDFDLGKNNFAYYDTDVADYHLSTGQFQAWNSGWSYRNDGVDIEKNNDNINSNGYNVGFVKEGEWMNYTVQINETAAYKLSTRIASQESGGMFHLSIDGEGITTVQTINSTGGWTNYETLDITNVLLDEGEHVLTVHIDSDIPFNISSIEFIKSGTADSISFVSLDGQTGEDEKSVEIAVNQSILVESINGSIDLFSVQVNGANRPINTVSIDNSRDRTIILTLDDYLSSNDEIKVSYNGTTIKSQSGKELQSFSDLIIRNVLPERLAIPGKIEAEDFINMLGLSTETTTDDGGGLNIGYTDPGDYADYLISIEDGGEYLVNFRLASQSNQGKIGLYLVDSNSIETELITITTPVTGGWQTWTTISTNLELSSGIHTLRMRILTGGFNLNWMEFLINNDDDGDGVINDDDQCPNSMAGVKVDVYGCEVFSLPTDNFNVLISGETCLSKNNGSISLTANKNYNYTAVLSGNSSATNTFSTETEFRNLSAGSYNICITIEGQTGYEQCFSIIVDEPEDLSVNSTVNTSSSKVTLFLSGGDQYIIELNEEIITTTESEIILDLLPSVNSLTIKTDKECQGVYKEVIVMMDNPLVYPNPIQDDQLFINMGQLDLSSIPVNVYDLNGKLVLSKVYQLNNGGFKIDVSNIPKGIYMLKMTTENRTYNYKIIR